MSNIELLEKTLPVAPLKIVSFHSVKTRSMKFPNPLFMSITNQTIIWWTAAALVLEPEKQKASSEKRSAVQIFLL